MISTDNGHVPPIEHYDLTPSAGAASALPSDHGHVTPAPTAPPVQTGTMDIRQAQASTMVPTQAQAQAPAQATAFTCQYISENEVMRQATAHVPAMTKAAAQAMTGTQYLGPAPGTGTQPPGLVLGHSSGTIDTPFESNVCFFQCRPD